MKLQGILLFLLISFILTNRISNDSEIKAIRNQLDNLDHDVLLLISYGLNFYLRYVRHISLDFFDLRAKSEKELKLFIIDNIRNNPQLEDFDTLSNLPSQYAEEIYEVMGFGKIDDILLPSKTFNDII